MKTLLYYVLFVIACTIIVGSVMVMFGGLTLNYVCNENGAWTLANTCFNCSMLSMFTGAGGGILLVHLDTLSPSWRKEMAAADARVAAYLASIKK